ncbi:unnamed protein product (macronuclear) [Paramecium tetraurelia]|uniref:TOG domain-containing protein n=1 Tax=Paramecium tetraurelia TaxID=5888 RepID=A0EAZ0_PARTE|nr:uncharacterized protein GSPATT00025191001 [Paramecium tetraurelia]CAK92457.1 unnamed protein product [Paramecium tetraurelia]|eukprot:XP_001459854.1 hypothetical protein (macronuclear) [Paramecium tetraurelia strain d4-2]
MNQPKNTRFITFTIPYAQSQDPQFPPSNLLEISSTPLGWQSCRFCQYPQELIFQFQSAITVYKMQILSHEKKIPTKIEVFIGRLQGRMDLENASFKKIGYFTFHSKEQSNWQARELKTVSIDESNCNYLKLLVHRNHENKFNPFNQVGIVAIRIYGEKAELPPPKKANKVQDKVLDELYNPQQDKLIDTKLLAHIIALEHSKDYAIKQENYQEAKKLKNRITQLRSLGVQLRDLEERKKEVLQNEDYDQAEAIKEQIHKLKIENGLVDEQGNEYKPNIDKIRQQELGEQIDNQEDRRNSKPSIKQIDNNKIIEDSFDRMPQDEQTYLMEQLNNNNNNITHITNNQNENANTSYQQPVSFDQQLKNDKLLNYDEMVIPALKNKQNNNTQILEEYSEVDKSKQQIEELSSENQKQVEAIKPYYGIDFCKNYFSKNWARREEGIRWLIEQFNNPTQINLSNIDGAFQATLLLIYKGIQDKADKVVYASLQLMQQTLLKLKPNKLNDESPIILDNIVLILMEKMGDINERHKEECKKILLTLAETQIMGSAGVINHLVKGITTKPNLQLSSVRHIQARLMLIYNLIQKYKINNERVPYNPVMDVALKYLDHSAEQVRTCAIYIITEIYKNQGDKVRESIKGIRPAQQQILEELFYKIDNGGNVQTSFEQEKKPQPKKKQQQNNPDQVFQQITQACEFCGIENKEFIQSQKLDMHLWKECVMLTTCLSCAQVVEVSQLTNHHFEECEFAKNYRQCETCGCAVLESQLAEHQNKKICNSSPGDTCPLCYKAIGLNWKIHLAICEQQERNKQQPAPQEKK